MMKIYEWYMWQWAKGRASVSDPELFGLVIEISNQIEDES